MTSEKYYATTKLMKVYDTKFISVLWVQNKLEFNLRSDACEQFKSIGLNYNDVVSGFSHLNYRQIYQLLEKI
jgi:hypothetical protein